MKIPAEGFRLLLASADADRALEFRHAPHADRPVVPAAHA